MDREQYIEVIFHNFHAIRRAVSHGSRFSNRHFGVTMTQASVLILLMHDGRKTMGEIAEILGVSKGAATQLLDGLVAQNFVERQQDNQDKRIVYVALSPHGHEHLRRVREKGSQHMSELFELLDDDELAQIMTITTKLAQKAKEIKS